MLSLAYEALATIDTRSPTITIGSQRRISGWKKEGGTIEFAAVETVTVAVSMELELMTCAFRVLVVLMAQLAFGASVLQEK